MTGWGLGAGGHIIQAYPLRFSIASPGAEHNPKRQKKLQEYFVELEHIAKNEKIF